METYIKICFDFEFSESKIAKLSSENKNSYQLELDKENISNLIDERILNDENDPINEEFVLENFRELGWNIELIEPEHNIHI